MTWFKVDDGFPEHPKLEAVLDDPRLYAETVCLWLAAGCYCSRRLTDGRVPKSALRGLVPFNPTKPAGALVEAGLWLDDGRAYLFHDWTDYQPSRAQTLAERDAKRKAGQKGAARRWGNNRDGTSDGSTHGTSDGSSDSTRHAPAERLLIPPSRPDPGRERSPLPRSRDPMEPLALRPDVQRLHEAWKLACNYPRHKFRGAYSAEARILADAIDTHGLEDCLLVAEYAPNDGMVSGKHDDKGSKHDSIGYVFDNAAAFHRILRAAQEQRGQSGRQRSAAELVAEAQKL